MNKLSRIVPKIAKSRKFLPLKYIYTVVKKFPEKPQIQKTILNRNNVKLSYSCMSNIKSIINSHNLLGNQCLTPNIVYHFKEQSHQMNQTHHKKHTSDYAKNHSKNATQITKSHSTTHTTKTTRTSGKCSLCLNEKLLILEASDVSKCRHQNKFKLSSLKTDVT